MAGEWTEPENDPALLRAELDACRARLDVLVLALLAVEREAEHHKARDMAWDHVWELAHAAVWGYPDYVAVPLDDEEAPDAG